jgi:glycerol-1-phosphate dehydrogenase [NAD(P)+]
MQQRLRTLGGAAHPDDLGIAAARLAADYRRARLIRRRYTVLDLLDDLGWLDAAITDLFSPGGFWSA